MVRTVRKWSPEAMEALRGALEKTDWNTLIELHGEDIAGILDCVSEYMDSDTLNKWSTVTQTTHPE